MARRTVTGLTAVSGAQLRLGGQLVAGSVDAGGYLVGEGVGYAQIGRLEGPRSCGRAAIAVPRSVPSTPSSGARLAPFGRLHSSLTDLAI